MVDEFPLHSGYSGYLGLFVELPDDSSQEVPQAEYKRVEIQLTQCGDAVVNEKPLQFPQAIESWGRVVGFGVFNRHGDLLVFGQISPCTIVLPGSRISIEAGSLRIEGFPAIAHFLQPLPQSKTLWERLYEEEDRTFKGKEISVPLLRPD